MKISKGESLFAWFFIFCLSLEAQTTIKGIVEDQNGNRIEKASVVVQDPQNNIIAYNYTNEQGEFLIPIENNNYDYFIVAAQILGFQEQRDSIRLVPGKNHYTISFKLKEKVEQLNEVVLESTKKISANGNVTTLQTVAFTDQTEQTVEDVLKKLPGIEVLDDGSIKAHGIFIDKLMIDGEDMFANDYQILSKNLDAKTLKAVQILDRFQDNPVLAKVLDSDRVALNLQLKEEFKNIWFGNATAGLGTEERVKASANIGLLRKKIKFFYFGDYNNLGNKASDQLGGTPSSLNISSTYQERKIETEINPVFSIEKNENKIFRDGQSTFNKALLNSLGFVTKLAPNLELRGTGSFTNDVQDQFFSAETIFNIEENPVRFLENSDTRHFNSIAAGELELKYTGGERSYLKNVFSYHNQPEEFANDLLFNNHNISQGLKKNEYSFYNHFNYSYVMGRDKVLHTYLYFGQNKIKQAAVIQSPVLNDLFSSPQNSEIHHFSNDKLDTYGITSNLFSNFGEFQHRLEISYESLKENRDNTLFIDASQNNVEVDSLQNNLDFEQQQLGLETSLSYSFSEKIKLSVGFSLDHLKIDIGANNKEEWIFNPEIDLDLRKLKMGRFNFSYKSTYKAPESIIFLKNYQLNSYRSFRQGTENIQFPKSNLFRFYYKWANELESQAFTFRTQYVTSSGRYSTANLIGQDLVLSSYRFVDSGDRISGSLNFTSYYQKLNLSTNFRTTQNWSTTPLQANSPGFNILKNYSASYLFSGTTYFDLPVNFGFEINLNRSQSEFNGVRSNTSWENSALDITYTLSKEWHASFNNELYQMENNSYYFLGSTINYQPNESNFSYRLRMNNLLDENSFASTVIDEYITYTSRVELLPRYLLLSMKYRF